MHDYPKRDRGQSHTNNLPLKQPQQPLSFLCLLPKATIFSLPVSFLFYPPIASLLACTRGPRVQRPTRDGLLGRPLLLIAVDN